MSAEINIPESTPGFLHLDLHVLFEKDSNSILKKIKKLDKFLKFENVSLHCAVYNLKALLLSKIPHRLNEAADVLKSCKDLHPGNLNTCVHLKYVYGRLYQTKRQKLFNELNEVICQSNRSEKERGICLLEQGFILLFEETVDRKYIAVKKLEEIFDVLSIEHVSDESSKKALNHSKYALETLRASIASREQRKLRTQNMCVEKLRRGLSLLSKHITKGFDERRIVFKYQLGVACFSYEEGLRKHDKNYADLELYQSLQTDIVTSFADVISNISKTHEQSLQIYKGRAVAFLVEYLLPQQKLKRLIDRGERKQVQQIMEINNNDDARQVRQKLLSSLSLAKECAPYDTTRIGHHGSSLWLYSKQCKADKQKYLKEAEDVLNTDSICLDFIGLSARMRTRMDIAFLTRDQKEKVDWLIKSRDDAIDCFHVGGRPDDLNCLGKICKAIAIESFKEHGLIESTKEIFHEAINHFNHSKSFGGVTCFKALQGMGECFYYLQKYRKAFDCMKHAMILTTELKSTPNRNEIKDINIESRTQSDGQGQDASLQNDQLLKVFAKDRVRHLSACSETDSTDGTDSIKNSKPEKVNSAYKFNYATNCLKNCCIYMIHLYEKSAGSKDIQQNRNAVLIDLRDIIIVGKLVNANIEEVIKYLCKMHFDTVKDLLFARVLSFKIEQHYVIAKLCIEHLIDHCKDLYIRDHLRDVELAIANTTPCEDSNLKIEDEFIKPECQFPPGPSKFLKDKEFSFDFFVSHSSKDAAWVKSFILDRLEMKWGENDTELKGCFADRDFTPGKSICNNIVESLEQSSKIILVISECFINSNWCQYEMDLSICNMLNKRKNCIIPILKDNCNVPHKLASITYLDLTDPCTILSQLHKLKKAVVEESGED